MDPQLIVLDEPVSALDVSIQAQVVNLLDDLQDDLGLSYVFIAHDLSVVRHVSDQIAVMYLGKLMELSPARELYTKPMHPYTEALLEAIPIPDPEENSRRERNVLGGEPPNPINPPSGCRFHTRCPHATEYAARSSPRWPSTRAVMSRPATIRATSPRPRSARHALAAEPAERGRGHAVGQRRPARSECSRRGDGGRHGGARGGRRRAERLGSRGAVRVRAAVVTMVCCGVAAGCGGGSNASSTSSAAPKNAAQVVCAGARAAAAVARWGMRCR